MRDSFDGYYQLSDDRFSALMKEGVVVFDANVLLNMYRIPESTRKEVFKVVESIVNRIWIPYHVALEFQRNRIKVISEEGRKTEDTLNYVLRSVREIKDRFDALQLDKHEIGANVEALYGDIESACSRLADAIRDVQKKQIEISGGDPIRGELDRMLSGRIGAAPKDQAEIDDIARLGEARFRNKIPPGFADDDKGKNSSDQNFMHDGILYEKKFGDLIIWKQLMREVKDNNIKSVIFVTSDSKEDWWWREQGKTIGPHPELVREIRREGGVVDFWMYSFSLFFERYSSFVNKSVSEESLVEISKAEDRGSETSGDNYQLSLGDLSRARRFSRRWRKNRENLDESEDIENKSLFKRIAVLNWIRQNYGPPEFIGNVDRVKVERGGLKYIFRIHSIDADDEIDVMDSVLLYSRMDVEFDDETNGFAHVVVIVVPSYLVDEIVSIGKASAYLEEIRSIIVRFGVERVVIGSVLGSEFFDLIDERRRW